MSKKVIFGRKGWVLETDKNAGVKRVGEGTGMLGARGPGQKIGGGWSGNARRGDKAVRQGVRREKEKDQDAKQKTIKTKRGKKLVSCIVKKKKKLLLSRRGDQWEATRESLSAWASWRADLSAAQKEVIHLGGQRSSELRGVRERPYAGERKRKKMKSRGSGERH